MPIAQTTLESFVRLQEEGNLGNRQRQIYTFVSFHPNCSDREISQGVGLPINCVVGRRSELARMGYIVQESVKHDERTNRNVMTWRVR